MKRMVILGALLLALAPLHARAQTADGTPLNPYNAHFGHAQGTVAAGDVMSAIGTTATNAAAAAAANTTAIATKASSAALSAETTRATTAEGANSTAISNVAATAGTALQPSAIGTTVAPASTTATANAAIPNTRLAFPSVANILDMPNQPQMTNSDVCEMGDSIMQYYSGGPDSPSPGAVGTYYTRRADGFQTQMGRLTGIFPFLSGNNGVAGDTTRADSSLGTPGMLPRLITILSTPSNPCYHAAFWENEGGINNASAYVNNSNTNLSPANTISDEEAIISREIASGSTVLEYSMFDRNFWGTIATPSTLAQWTAGVQFRRYVNAVLRDYCLSFTKCRWIPTDAPLGGTGEATYTAATVTTGTTTTVNVSGIPAADYNYYRGWTAYFVPSSGTALGTSNIVTANTLSYLTFNTPTPAPTVGQQIILSQGGAGSFANYNPNDGLHPGPVGAEQIAAQTIALNPDLFPPQTPGELSNAAPYDAVVNPYGSVLNNGQMLQTNGTLNTGGTGIVPAGWQSKQSGVTSTGTQVMSVPCGGSVPGGGCAFTETISRTAAGGSQESFYFTQTPITNPFPVGTYIYAKCQAEISGLSEPADYLGSYLQLVLNGGTNRGQDGTTQWQTAPQISAGLNKWLYYQTPLALTTGTQALELDYTVLLSTTDASSGNNVNATAAISNCGIFQGTPNELP
jgi:hypothetical protein